MKKNHKLASGALFVVALAVLGSTNRPVVSSAVAVRGGQQWIGTWATAPQPSIPGGVQSFRNQTLRLIVHTSAGGAKVRIRISNTFGDQIGRAHV